MTGVTEHLGITEKIKLFIVWLGTAHAQIRMKLNPQLNGSVKEPNMFHN